MTEPPADLTVIGWFWRLAGAAAMVFALLPAVWSGELFGKYWTGALLGLNPTVLFLIAFLSSSLCLLCGNGLLKGQNWARILAVVYCVAGTLIGATVNHGHPLYETNLIGTQSLTMVLWFFLFRPGASVFFKEGVPLGKSGGR